MDGPIALLRSFSHRLQARAGTMFTVHSLQGNGEDGRGGEGREGGRGGTDYGPGKGRKKGTGCKEGGTS